MAGPAQPWDQPEDPRDQTVDLPRIDPASNGNGRSSANGDHAAFSGEPDGQPPSRNGHSPATNGTPQWPVLPEPPLRPLPEVNGDPYAQPDRQPRPSSLFEPLPRAASGRPMPPAPARPAQRPPPGPPVPAQPSPPVAPPEPGTTRSSPPTPAAAPESADHSEPPEPARSPPPEHAAPDAGDMPADPAGDARSGAAAVASVGPVRRAYSDGQQAVTDSDDERAVGEPRGQRAVADPPRQATPVPNTAQADPARRPEPDQGRGRPAPGSLADLRSRLDRLPDGHPSSPYEDGGAAKPLPHRLKQLELGLPAPERDDVDGTPRLSRPADAGPAEQASRPREPAPGPAADLQPGQPNAAAVPAHEDTGERARSGDRVTDFAAVPDGDTATNGNKGRDDPADAWRDPYALARPSGNGVPGSGSPAVDERHLEAHRDKPNDDRPGRDDPDHSRSDHSRSDHSRSDRDRSDRDRSDRDRRDDRHRIADAGTQPYRELRAAAGPPEAPPRPSEPTGPGDRRARTRPDEHAGTDPNRRGGSDPNSHGGSGPNQRRRDPGQNPRRGDRGQAGDRLAGSRQLSAEAGELVGRLLADGRAAEGQTAFGSYGASGLTPVIRRIADQLSAGGLAPGSEATSLKSAERLSAKLARLVARHPDRTPSQLAASICDVIRYAFAFEPDSFTEGTWHVHRRLKAQGFELEARRNRWESPVHKGIWTRWRDPASDLSFEIQFHTFASWDVLVGTHEDYRVITDPATPPRERARIRARQVAASAGAKAPPHCEEIADFGIGAR